MKTLVIVESPAKAKTIQKYLGPGFQVQASVGHIRDLPANKSEIPEQYATESWARLGIDVAGGFKPLYVVPKDKKAKVAELRNLAREADRTILATDGDREGEAIAWHLARELGLKNPERMEFHEITKEAIQQAVQQLRPLNFALVGAQESRRLLDRLYGYGVSPALWQCIGPGLSAGRVQSAALVSLAHREQLRMAHVTAPFMRAAAQVQPAGEAPPFRAVVMTLGGQPLATAKDFGPDGALKPDSPALIITPEQGEQLVGFLKSKGVTVQAVTTKPYTSRPPAPFITSTLQQAASAALKFTPKHTMQIAQRLYETGCITYMRTDSPSLSDEAVSAARNAATAAFGADVVPPTPREYAAKGKNAQEAHEAIRPAGKIFRTPEEIQLEGDDLALYELIYRRTVASQMTDLQGEKTVLSLTCGRVGLEAAGKVVLHPGFTQLYLEVSEKDSDGQDQALPALIQGQHLAVPEAKAEAIRTPAPARFTQSSLVQALEKAGVGRPSTYAAILDTLLARGYARTSGQHLVVTWLGLVVAAYLQQQFGSFVGVTFTAKMESDLDRIAQGELTREAYLTEFWSNNLEPMIAQAVKAAPAIPIPKVPGAVVTAQAEAVVLAMDGKAVALPPDLAPDQLTPEVATKIMSGQQVTRPIRSKAKQGKRSSSAKGGKGKRAPAKSAPTVT